MANDKDSMHPQDLRNMLIFCILASLLYFTYDAYVLRPKAELLKQQKAAQAQQVALHPELVPPADKPPVSRKDALSQSPRVQIDNGEIFGSIALKGARLDDIAFHNFYEEIDHKNQVVLLSPPGTEFPRFVEYGWVASEGTMPLPGADTLWTVKGNSKLTKENAVTLEWNNGQGLVFDNVYSIDDNYVVTLTQNVTNNTGKNVTLVPYGLVSQTGLPPKFAPIWIAYEGPIGFVGSSLVDMGYGSLRKTPTQGFEGAQGWAGVTDKYWLTALIPPQGQDVKYRYSYVGTTPAGGAKDTGKYQVDYTATPLTIAPGKTGTSESHIFAGAKKVLLLQQYNHDLNIPHFDLAVDFGWFWFFTMPFFYLLHYLTAQTGSFALGLIFMTIIVRTAVFPLTSVSFKSFAKMKKVGPQVAQIRDAYADDKKKMQEELMKLYEREGVNPMAGCLPILAQGPVLFSLYKVFVNTIEMRQAPFVGWVHDLSAPDPTTILNLFGLIPWTPPAWLPLIGVWPCFLLCGFLLQRKLNPPPTDPIQRDMNVYYPFLMCWMMARFSSGLVIYWTISAFYGIAQQIFIMKKYGVPIHLFGETEAEAKIIEQDKEGVGAGVHPLLAMVEKEAGLDEDGFVPGPGVSPPKPRRKKKK